jgi:hypothetical protein
MHCIHISFYIWKEGQDACLPARRAKFAWRSSCALHRYQSLLVARQKDTDKRPQQAAACACTQGREADNTQGSDLESERIAPSMTREDSPVVPGFRRHRQVREHLEARACPVNPPGRGEAASSVSLCKDMVTST